MEKYYNLGDDTISKLNEYISKYVNSPIRIDYVFVGDNKLKKLVKVARVPDVFTFLHKEQVIVYINEALWDALTEEESVLELLVREEFNTICINTDSGKIKIEKPSFVSSSSVIEKYTYDSVNRAKQLEKLTLASIEDKETESIDISA